VERSTLFTSSEKMEEKGNCKRLQSGMKDIGLFYGNGLSVQTRIITHLPDLTTAPVMMRLSVR